MVFKPQAPAAATRAAAPLKKAPAPQPVVEAPYALPVAPAEARVPRSSFSRQGIGPQAIVPRAVSYGADEFSEPSPAFAPESVARVAVAVPVVAVPSALPTARPPVTKVTGTRPFLTNSQILRSGNPALPALPAILVAQAPTSVDSKGPKNLPSGVRPTPQDLNILHDDGGNGTGTPIVGNTMPYEPVSNDVAPESNHSITIAAPPVRSLIGIIAAEEDNAESSCRDIPVSYFVVSVTYGNTAAEFHLVTDINGTVGPDTVGTVTKSKSPGFGLFEFLRAEPDQLPQSFLKVTDADCATPQ